MNRRWFLYGGGAAVVAAAGAAGLLASRADQGSPVTVDAIGDQVQTVPRGQLPRFASTADTQRLYRYAVEHGDELQYFPCFCGCYQFGHVSNRDCYIKAVNGDGTLTFTSHAAT
jgi:hypothetical protein